MKLRLNASTLVLHAALIVILVVSAIPFLWALLNSFKTNIEIFSGTIIPETFTLANYAAAWTTGQFGQTFYNSLFISLVTVAIVVAVSVPAGYAFAHLWLRKFPALFYVFIVGLAIPQEAFIISLFYQLREMGLINSLWGVIWPTAAVAIPFAVLLMRNAFLDAPRSLLEAAQMDGAGSVSTFFFVMMPLVKPSILVVAVLSFLDAWNEFLISLLVLVTPAVRTIPIGIFAFVSEYGTNYAAIFAATVLSILPSIVIYVLFQRSFVSGVSAGAVKE